MIQTRGYEFLVRPTPQREWIEKRGILMWLAMFFIELGAGTFLVSSIFSVSAGMIIGWLMCGALGGGFHLAYLGRSIRFWRMMLSSGWKTSWISRGLIFVSLFLLLGLLHLILLQWASPLSGLLVLADVFAFLTIIYVGFVMASVNGIMLWNTALLPVLYLILGLWGGLGLTLLTMLATGATSKTANVEDLSRLFLIAFIFVVFVYLFTVRYQGTTGKVSVKAIVTGKLAPLFWIGVAFLGTAFPAGVALATWLANVSMPATVVFVLIVFELLGDLSLRYCILKAGLYAPLIPSSSYV
jgi:formate-dependent nitrite reductase membrane component NrfD